MALGSLARRKHEALLERHRKFKTGCGVRGIFLEDVPLARVSQASVRRYTGPSGEDFAVGGRTALYTSRPDINLCPRLRTRRVKGRKTSCRNRKRRSESDFYTRWKQGRLLRFSGHGALHEGFASVNSYRVGDPVSAARRWTWLLASHSQASPRRARLGKEATRPRNSPSGKWSWKAGQNEGGVRERAMPESVPRKDETRIKVSGGL